MNKSYHLKENEFSDSNSSLSRVFGHQETKIIPYFLTLVYKKKKRGHKLALIIIK